MRSKLFSSVLALTFGSMLPGWGGLSPALAGPAFAQCPAIGADTGCALLINLDSHGAVTISSDPAQGPFDGIDDTLVGVVNQSCLPLNGLNFSSAAPIFGFDGDGICGSSISPKPAECPFGATGYEGPGVSFSPHTQNSGAVNFSPPLGTSASTYFSLEAALSPSELFSRLTTNSGRAVVIDLTEPLGHPTLEDTGQRTFTTSTVYHPNPLITIPPPVSPLVSGTVLNVSIDAEDTSTTSSAFVEQVMVNVPSAPTLTLRSVHATSRSTLCEGNSGTTTIAFLQVGSSTPVVDFSPPPNDVILSGPVSLILNQQIATPNGLIVNAVHLTVPAVGVDLVISSASSAIQLTSP